MIKCALNLMEALHRALMVIFLLQAFIYFALITILHYTVQCNV